MQALTRRLSSRLTTCLLLLGAAALVLAGAGAKAEQPSGQKENKQVKEPVVLPAPRVQPRDAAKTDKVRSIVRLGYTRPGSPSDEKTNDGKIKRVAWDPAFRGELIGGTIYFMVLELTGSDGDAWGTGVRNFNDSFVEGRDNDDRSSPNLDIKARYLYLYQVVNDRGLDPHPNRPAANQEILSQPIAMSALKLRVDPRYITSWGHFNDVCFAGEVIDRKLDGTSAAAVGAADTMIRMAVSSNPSILAELPEQAYTYASPAYSLTGNLRNTFGLDQAQVGLGNSTAMKELRGKLGVGAAVWVKHMAGGDGMAEKIARSPDFVKLTVANLPALAAAKAEEDTLETVTVLRADWRSDKNALKLGQHSMVFGFTSDLPPIDEVISIADAAGAAKAGDTGILAVANAGGMTPGIAPAVAPSPAPPAAPLASAPVGGLGSLPAIGGSAVPGAAIGAGAGLPAVAGGLGGLGGGVGSTSGNTNQPTTTQQQQQNQQQQNQQQQNQNQNQQQQQNQNQQETPPNEVIPEPSTIIMAVLGLPVLFWLARRRLTCNLRATA